MNPEKNIKRVRRRDARLQRRRSKKGKLDFIVRWMEDIEGKAERQSKSFSSEVDALKFIAACRVKLGIIHTVKTMMADQLRPSADLRRAIEEYVEEVRKRCFERSTYADQLAFYLLSIVECFGWRRTHEIPVDACAQIETSFASRGSYTVRAMQRSLKAFVRNNERRYAFAERICDAALARHKVKNYYIWLDEEKNLILQALTAPLRYPDGLANLPARKRRAARRSALCSFYKRRALFPVIWIQMLWALRPRETTLLRVEHWNPRTNELVLTKDITKTKQERSFVVDRVTAAMLNCLTKGRTHKELVFRTAYGMPWNGYNDMSRQFREILRSLSIRGSLYSCRHYAVTTLVELMPGKLRSVMMISGHARLETVARYLGLKGNRQLPAAGIYDNIYEEVLRRVKPSTMEIPMPSPSSDTEDLPPDASPAPVDRGPKPSMPPTVAFVVEEE
jgi:integrase